MTASPAEHEPAPTGTDTGTPAGTPPAQDGTSERLAAVQAILEGKAPASGGEETATAAPEEKGEAAGEDKAADAPATETPPEAEAEADPGSEIDRDPALPEKTRKRIDHLLSERTALRQKAEVAERMDAFIADAGLSRDEVNAGFDLMRDLKRNPAEFLKKIAVYVQKAEEVTGVRLPEPIAKKVEDGALDEESAKELAAAKRQLAEREAADLKAREDARRSMAEAVGKAIDGYEERWKAADLAFDKKIKVIAPAVSAELRRRVEAGEVITPALATQVVDSERKKLDELLGGVAPAKTSTRPDPGARRAIPAARNGGVVVSRLEAPRAILDGQQL